MASDFRRVVSAIVLLEMFKNFLFIYFFRLYSPNRTANPVQPFKRWESR